MEMFYGLLATLVLGTILLLGALIAFLTKSNDKFLHLSLNLSLGVMISLLILEIIPETYEVLSEQFSFPITMILLVGFTLLGILLLKFIDNFLPHHEAKESGNNYFHIGLITMIALGIHNMVEGAAVVNMYQQDLSSAIMFTIGIALHNLPLGIVIASSFYHEIKSIKKTLLYLIPFVLSTFIGGLLILIETLEVIMLLFTSGMIIYLAIYELLPHILNSKNKVLSVGMFLLGAFLVFITTLF